MQTHQDDDFKPPMASPNKVVTPSSRASLALQSPLKDPPQEVLVNETKTRRYLPDVWTDNKRINVLFADFRSREANPEGWDLKMAFWIKAIDKWMAETSTVKFGVEDVRRAFERSGVLPQINCIKLVVSEMKRRKLIVTRQQFENEKVNNGNAGWTSWGWSTFVHRPVSWIGSKVIGQELDCEEIDPQVTPEAEFISLKMLQSLCGQVEQMAKEAAESCVVFEDFYTKCCDKLNVDVETFEYLIYQLQSENKMKFRVDGPIKVIKFGVNVTITDSELVPIRLEAAKELVEKEIQRHEDEIEQCKVEARICVKEKNTHKAKAILRRKKRLENKILDCQVQIDNIEVLLEQIANAKSQKQILAAFQKANEALKSTHLNMDEAENTILDVEDTLEVVSNISADISRPLVNADIDFEDELQKLLQEGDSNEDVFKNRQDEELQDILDNLEVVNKSPTAQEKRSRVAQML